MNPPFIIGFNAISTFSLRPWTGPGPPLKYREFLKKWNKED
jgi:hypothetical protein